MLITLGNLYRHFSDPLLTIEAALRSAVLNSLEKRWGKADQDAFLLALVLNPYIRTKIFHPTNPLRTMAALWAIVRRCCDRFWDGLVPDHEFRRAFSDYLTGVGEWSDIGLCLDELKKGAAAEVRVSISNIFAPLIFIIP